MEKSANNLLSNSDIVQDIVSAGRGSKSHLFFNLVLNNEKLLKQYVLPIEDAGLYKELTNNPIAAFREFFKRTNIKLDFPDPIDMSDFAVETPPNKRPSKDYKAKGVDKLRNTLNKKKHNSNPLLDGMVNNLSKHA